MSEYAGPEPGEDYFAGSAITDWAAEHIARGQDMLDSGPDVLGVEAAQAHWLKAQAQFMASIAVSLYEISQRPIPEPIPLTVSQYAAMQGPGWSEPRSFQPTVEELREIISRTTREAEAQFITDFQEQESRAAGEGYEPNLDDENHDPNDEYETPDDV
jgi:hypothetical protein